MVFTALIALFALDSVMTYLGITHMLISEWNPVVRYLIEALGLATTMSVIFVFKTAALTFGRMATRTRPCFHHVWRTLLLFYTGALSMSWALVFK